MSTIVEILVARDRGHAMTSVESVEALTDCGLVGDRYANPKYRKSPDYQLTLIEIENIEQFVRDTGLALSPDAPRRNLVTRGVRLNELVGKRFSAGLAVLEGLELCEPCSLFATRTYPSVVKYFLRKGGLRARIIQGGTIRVHDFVGVHA
jgi:MOSC domain-containing protein YiiM